MDTPISVLDVDVASGARVLLVRVQSAGHHIGLTRVKLNGDGAFRAVTFVTGGNLARHETHIRLLGEGAHAGVHGAILRPRHHACRYDLALAS